MSDLACWPWSFYLKKVEVAYDDLFIWHLLWECRSTMNKTAYWAFSDATNNVWLFDHFDLICAKDLQATDYFTCEEKMFRYYL